MFSMWVAVTAILRSSYGDAVRPSPALMRRRKWSMPPTARAKREGADISFMVGDATGIPFDPERFDVIVAVTILCFVADAPPVFREIARVLRPGGGPGDR